MNIATLIGLLFGIVVLATAILSATGDAQIFWYPEGIAIVLGGVVAATFICFPLREVVNVFQTFTKALTRDDQPVTVYIAEIHYLAQQAATGDLSQLEHEYKGAANQFLKDGLGMLIDRAPIEQVREFMEHAIDAQLQREYAEAAILRTMARFSPAFGMVGTLIGLIAMFRSMGDDLSQIGNGMAVAMMTTFYGILLSNLIFMPIAIKIERRANERAVLMTVIMEGLLLVARKTPPELVMEQLKVYLPTPKWKEVRLRTMPANAGETG